MKCLNDLYNLLPKYQDIEAILEQYPISNHIISKALDLLNYTKENPLVDKSSIEENGYLLQALQDKLWECIHTGHFSQVSKEIRQIFFITCLLKICFLLLQNSNDIQHIKKCSQTLDEALLLGHSEHIYNNCDKLKADLMEFLDNRLLSHQAGEFKVPVIDIAKRLENVQCDIQQLCRPSIEMFRKCCFNAQLPALLLDTFNEWPALKLWHDLNYIIKLAGNRLVPIEIGNNYANENWSQQLKTLNDFIINQFQTSGDDNVIKTKDIEYLAQHELFEQIPLLKKDFSIPDYCSLGNNLTDIDVKAWLGPKGTVSPLHHDPKHNFLCQVFGSKKIVLAAPQDSPNLYPHRSEFLQNTSELDIENLDLEQYPLARNVTFFHLTIQRGDCLYIPPKWWHYVKSLSASFSISFWWD